MRATSVLLLCSSLVGCGTAGQHVRVPDTDEPAKDGERIEAVRAPDQEALATNEERMDAVQARDQEAAVRPPGQRRAKQDRPGEKRRRSNEQSSLRADIVGIARQYVGVRSLRKVTRDLPDDCTGFVRLVFEQVDIELMNHGQPKDNGVTAMWRGAKRSGALVKRAMRPGDLVFFLETYDRNRDGRRNDGLTHVGIVEEILADGTVVFLHRAGQGVSRSRFHPRAPTVRHTNDGRVLNDYLRAKSRKYRAYTAGELWAGAASPDALR